MHPTMSCIALSQIRKNWLISSLFLFLPTFSLAQNKTVFLSSSQGTVEVQQARSTDWVRAEAPFPLNMGDRVRTGRRAKAQISLQDGSRLELGRSSSFEVGSMGSTLSSLRLTWGRLKAWVSHVADRRFEVRTPTAVAAVRGTEFEIQYHGGTTSVDLYNGLLAVSDNHGNEVLLKPNEHIEVAQRIGTPRSLSDAQGAQNQADRQDLRREVGLDMSKEEVQAAAAKEIKLAEFQQGKTMMDVNGDRVRLEEYILRPQPDQFKFVILNEREKRFDYFYYLGTFNTTLPTDLSVALRQLPGCANTACSYYLTSFETGRSNTQDSLREVARSGHLVDVNNNLDSTDNVSAFYDPTTDSFINLEAGAGFYQTLYDKYGFYVNGGLKYGWTGSNIQSYGDATPSSTADPISGATLAQALPSRSVVSTWPDANVMKQNIYESYSDGTFINWDNYIISDEGAVAQRSAFNGATTGSTFKSILLNYNYEQSITASEFQGRKIDLVVEPKILIQSGLI
ncbi:MAG: FecR domain-containing protein, partial [Elusimicrobia bacterium]|nr:FecR domain-containing protein [Elusimicrobiota bacterium]